MSEPLSTRAHGIRMRHLFVACIVLVTAAVTVASLWIVRHRLREKVTSQFADDLTHSVETFRGIEAHQLEQLQRENLLLANLPTLKALMTTSDVRTIANSSLDFWKMSGNDLFGLAGRDGRMITVYARSLFPAGSLAADLDRSLSKPGRHYVLSGSRLYEYAVRPLYFGDEATGTLLGYVVNGDAVDATAVRRVTHASSVEAAYVSGTSVVVSTLPALVGDRPASLLSGQHSASETFPISIHGERFLATRQDITQSSSGPLQLVVLKSFAATEREISEIDRLVLVAGALATLIGVLLMLMLSERVTEPLEALAAGVKAFGTGDDQHALPIFGPLEVRELSIAFAGMRDHIQRTNQALLESVRLATIGRMAFSVSHDLRHYLSTVSANAEFLASSRLSPPEKQEILLEIRGAVHGTTDLLDSLLVFSRNGVTKRRSHELVAALLERTIALVRAHPDAQGVTLTAEYDDPVETAAYVDARQIERAIFNLLLNACQAGSGEQRVQQVVATLRATPEMLRLSVRDDGPGVPATVRDTLFEPFVSEGKQKGTGLGLTLVHSIATEHDGTATLFQSRPGETIFHMQIARVSGGEPEVPSIDLNPPPQEILTRQLL